MEFYVYHLIDPVNGMPFYVGKGKNNRMYEHEISVLNGKIPHNNKLLFYKIKKVLVNSKNIQYTKIKENIDEKESFLLEIQEIKKYGRKNNKTGILCNLTDGGEGTSGHQHDKKTRQKMSNKSKEKYRINISKQNFKIACKKNQGKRKLKPHHQKIIQLYKTMSIKKVQKELNVDFTTLKKYLIEYGLYIKNKNRRDSDKTKLKKSISNKGKRSRPVIQLDLDENIIKEWSCMSDACIHINKPNRQGDIQSCCNGKQHTAFGYKWKYK